MSTPNKNGGKTGDPETDEILAEMEEDGEKPPFAPASEDESKDGDEVDEEEEEDESEDDEEEDEEEDDDEDSEDEDEEESDEEDSEDEDEEDDVDEESEDSEDDDEDEDEEGEDEDDEDDNSSAKKPAWMRLREEKKRRKDAEALVEKLQGSKTESEMKEKLEAFAKANKLAPEAVKELATITASLAANQLGIKPEEKKEIDSFLKERQQQKFWTKQDKAFDADFRKNVLPLAKRDGADVAKIRKTLHALAFEPANVKNSLVELYLKNAGKPAGKGKRTSESGRAFRHGKSEKDPSELNPDDIDSMSDEEFDQLSETLEKSSKLKIIRH